MKRPVAVKNAIEQVRQWLGAGYSDPLTPQLEAIDAAGDDFEAAYLLYRGFGRILVDTEPLHDSPALVALDKAMQNWRRARKRGLE